jgi:hypothetical protein
LDGRGLARLIEFLVRLSNPAMVDAEVFSGFHYAPRVIPVTVLMQSHVGKQTKGIEAENPRLLIGLWGLGFLDDLDGHLSSVPYFWSLASAFATAAMS